MLLPPNAYRADRAGRGRPLPRGRQGRPAGRRLQQPDRHEGRPDPRLLAELHGEGLIVGRQGVHRRRAARATRSPSRPRARRARRVGRRGAGAGARRSPTAGSPASPTPCPPSASRSGPRRSRATWRGAARVPGLHPLLRWDSKTEFVQAIKLTMDRSAGTAARAVRRACRSRRARRPSSGRPPRGVAAVGRLSAMRTQQQVLHAVDSHTEGMPTRVITGGVGVMPGATMAERRQLVHRQLDDLRTLLMYEPRGHARDVRRDPAAADPARRRLGRAVHRGVRLPADVRARHDRGGDGAGRDRHGAGDRAGDHDPAGHPGRAGRRRGRGRDDGAATSVTLRNVPSFALALDRAVDVPGFGAGRLRPGLRRQLLRHRRAGRARPAVRPRRRRTQLLDAGLAIMAAINEQDAPVHPVRAGHQRLPPRATWSPPARRAALPARDGDLPGLVRPVAVRHRHQRPDGPAARAR